MNNKKILIISNEPFSKSSSNGRTLMNFFMNISSECLAQFYIHGNLEPDFCSVYYRVSDEDALNAFLLRKKNKINKSQNHTGITSNEKKPARNLKNLFLRNKIWQSMRWYNKDFDEFLNSFKLDIVLLQAGDSPFMYSIALKTARKCSAALMMFNTESYVLKKYLYSSVKKNT